MLVGIIGAMDLEVQALKGLMDNAVVETISTIDFYKGNINGVETVVAVAWSRQGKCGGLLTDYDT